jgi:hypothetical protein
MRPGELDLFRRFYALAPIAGAQFAFDFRLGRGISIDPSWPPEIQAMAKALTQRRVDVVATTPSATWILEIKPRAGPSAVGQLLLYRELYVLEHKPPTLPRLGIICDRNSFDMLDVYSAFAIALFLV